MKVDEFHAVASSVTAMHADKFVTLSLRVVDVGDVTTLHLGVALESYMQ